MIEHRRYGVRKYIEDYGLRVSCEAMVWRRDRQYERAIHVRYQLTDAEQARSMTAPPGALYERSRWALITDDGLLTPSSRLGQDYEPTYRPGGRLTMPGEVSEGWITFLTDTAPVVGVLFTWQRVAVRWDEHPAAERKLIGP